MAILIPTIILNPPPGPYGFKSISDLRARRQALRPSGRNAAPARPAIGLEAVVRPPVGPIVIGASLDVGTLLDAVDDCESARGPGAVRRPGSLLRLQSEQLLGGVTSTPRGSIRRASQARRTETFQTSLTSSTSWRRRAGLRALLPRHPAASPCRGSDPSSRSHRRTSSPLSGQ